MKKLLVLLVVVACSYGAHAQSLIKTSPGGLAFGIINACYETPVSEKASIQFTGSAFFGIGDVDGTAFGAGVSYRMFMNKTKDAPHGFYVGPGVGGAFGEGAGAISISVPLGYQWIWDSGFALDIGLGPAYYIAISDDVDDSFDGILPTVILAVGYQF